MEGPLNFHRRIATVYELLHKAGFHIEIFERHLDGSGDSWTFDRGTKEFFVSFANGTRVVVVDWSYNDMEQQFDIVCRDPNVNVEWFGSNHIYSDDYPPMIWRFYRDMLDELLAKFEALGEKFGK